LWLANNASDGGDVANEIEVEPVVERGIDGIRITDEEQRVAIRGRLGDSLGGDIAAGARPVSMTNG